MGLMKTLATKKAHRGGGGWWPDLDTRWLREVVTEGCQDQAVAPGCWRSVVMPGRLVLDGGIVAPGWFGEVMAEARRWRHSRRPARGPVKKPLTRALPTV